MNEEEEEQQVRQWMGAITDKMAEQGYNIQDKDWWIYEGEEENTPYQEYEVMAEVNDPHMSVGTIAEVVAMTKEQLAARLQERTISPNDLRLRIDLAIGSIENMLLDTSAPPREGRILRKLRKILEGHYSG